MYFVNILSFVKNIYIKIKIKIKLCLTWEGSKEAPPCKKITHTWSHSHTYTHKYLFLLFFFFNFFVLSLSLSLLSSLSEFSVCTGRYCSQSSNVHVFHLFCHIVLNKHQPTCVAWILYHFLYSFSVCFFFLFHQALYFLGRFKNFHTAINTLQLAITIYKLFCFCMS